VRNQRVLQSFKERNIVHTVTGRKDNWIGHILHRNSPLKHVTEGKMREKHRSHVATRNKTQETTE
jgi:hypothetical protein